MLVGVYARLAAALGVAAGHLHAARVGTDRGSTTQACLGSPWAGVGVPRNQHLKLRRACIEENESFIRVSGHYD
jgi:hypothetical protein